MEDNTLFQSLDRKTAKLSQDAETIKGTLDVLTSALVGMLITERLIDYAGQPGQTVEYLSVSIAETLLNTLAKCDTVELDRYLKITPDRFKDK